MYVLKNADVHDLPTIHKYVQDMLSNNEKFFNDEKIFDISSGLRSREIKMKECSILLLSCLIDYDRSVCERMPLMETIPELMNFVNSNVSSAGAVCMKALGILQILILTLKEKFGSSFQYTSMTDVLNENHSRKWCAFADQLPPGKFKDRCSTLCSDLQVLFPRSAPGSK